MPITVVVRSARAAGADGAGSEARADDPALVFDAPRVVVGRGEGCELRLPDPSVSARHASIRQRGAEYILLDEGSTNGTYIDRVRLAPQSPRVLKHGDLLRIGRVWLEVRLGVQRDGGEAPAASAATTRALAMELLLGGLAALGEDGRPKVAVVGDPARSLRLERPDTRYVVGRAADAALVLGDEELSRRHLEVSYRGDQVFVRDLGSRTGTVLDGESVGGADRAWRPGALVELGATRLELAFPATGILAELTRAPDETMRSDESVTPPPSIVAETAPAPDAAAPEPPTSGPAPGPAPVRRPAAAAAAEDDRGWGLSDVVIVIVGLAVLVLSVVGLVLLLR